jgi:hypothetical protein
VTSRVGRVPPHGDSAAFDAALDGLEALLANGEVEVAAAQTHLGQLRDRRPFYITAKQIERLFGVCYRLLGVVDGVVLAPQEGRPQAVGHLRWSAADLIETSLHDVRQDSRVFIERSVDHARVLHPGEVAERTTHYQPFPHVPLHRAAAAALLRPWLAWLDARREAEPVAHLPLVWKAVTCPLPPFEGIIWDWLDGRGEGEDMRLALSLHDLRERAQQRLSWAQFEARLIPLLSSENPLIVGHAAAFVGSLFNDDCERLRGDGACDGRRILAHIAGLPRHRRVAAGAFLNGIDAMDPDPFAELARIAPDLDLADWVMSVLEDRGTEPYIPGCQMFWFYLHEHYARDPGMCLRFVEAGHADIAWMCITENHPPAEGMDQVLARMAEGSDPDYAAAARKLLGTLRAAPSSTPD